MVDAGRPSSRSGGSTRAASERTKAIRRLAMLVGAVVIARAVGRGTLRNEIFAACNQDLGGHAADDEAS